MHQLGYFQFLYLATVYKLSSNFSLLLTSITSFFYNSISTIQFLQISLAGSVSPSDELHQVLRSIARIEIRLSVRHMNSRPTAKQGVCVQATQLTQQRNVI